MNQSLAADLTPHIDNQSSNHPSNSNVNKHKQRKSHKHKLKQQPKISIIDDNDILNIQYSDNTGDTDNIPYIQRGSGWNESTIGTNNNVHNDNKAQLTVDTAKATTRRYLDSDDDLSPARRRNDSDTDHDDIKDQSNNEAGKYLDSDDDIEVPRRQHTGLQNSNEFAIHTRNIQQQQLQSLQSMPDSVSGRNSIPIKRNRTTGNIMTSDDINQQQSKHNKPMEWSSGLVQQQLSQQNKQYYINNSKDYVRTADDIELNQSQRTVIRTDDPMKYMINKKPAHANTINKHKPSRSRSKSPELPIKHSSTYPATRPYYTGDIWPNRYNIRPGYRWDGVDRSNGFEQRYFQSIQQKKQHDITGLTYGQEDM